MNEDQDQRKQAFFALMILFGINTMNFFDRQITAAVTEPLRMQWNLSDTAMGVMGTAFTLIYAAVGVPLGRWADRGTRRTIVSLGVTVWSLFTAAAGAAWSYWSLFLARMGVGVGEASCSPAANSLIGDLYPAEKRARAISVFMLGLPVGITLCNLLCGVIVEASVPYVGRENAWKTPFFVATIPGLILGYLALRIREPRRGASEAFQVRQSASGGGTNEDGSPYRRVLSIPTMWWIIVSGALHNFNAYAVNAFMPAYMGRYHGLGLIKANVISGLVLGAVGIIGLLAGGVAADWARRKSPNGRMLLGSICIFTLTPCVYLALSQPKGQLLSFALLMGGGWMLFFVYYVTVYPTVQDVVEPGLRGTAMALYFFAMYVLGGAFGTSVLGFLSDHFAKRAMVAAGATAMAEPFKAAGLHDAFMMVPIVSLALALVLFAASRTVAKDMEKLHQWMVRNAA